MLVKIGSNGDEDQAVGIIIIIIICVFVCPFNILMTNYDYGTSRRIQP